ncbi:MAG: enoyl-CoA hydratase-related protein [Pikeienuella sp.]
MADTDHLHITREGDVLHLKLNRPDRLNALSADMRDGLIAAFRKEYDAPRDQAARAILITAAGRGFCSGTDIDPAVILARRDTIKAEMEAGISQLVHMMRTIPVPVIAAVQGPAAGAGFSIALCADLLLVSESAKLVMTFSRIGAMMDGGATHILPRRIGMARATALAMLAKPLDAEQALDLGLAVKLTTEETLQAEAETLAQRLANGPTRSLGLVKAGLEHAQTSTLQEALAFEAAAQQDAFASPDFEEGIIAFTEKRKPRFTGQ